MTTIPCASTARSGTPHRGARRRSAHHRVSPGRLVAAACALATALVAAPAHAHPAAGPDCPDPVVLVHDMGRDDSEFASLAAALRSSGFCTAAFTYGATTATAPLAGVGAHAAGLARIEDSAAELSGFLRALAASGTSPSAIVAHGAGSLVAQHVLQHEATPVRSLVTLGPLWHGTNVGELGTAERLSRDLGTYDAVLALETPVVDPICAGCRQLVAGSPLLTDLQHAGIPTPGIDYTDIVSLTDGLVAPPQSNVPGIRSVTLQRAAPGSVTDHFALPDDPVVERLTAAALHRPAGPLT